MSKEITQEDLSHIEEQLEERVVKAGRKRKKNNDIEMPISLRELSGEDVIEVFRFLHRQYLSWMSEAEASKYTDIVRQIRSETVDETKKIYDYIISEYEKKLEEYSKTLEIMSKRLEELSTRIQQPGQPIQVSILEDRRVRALLFPLLDTLLKNNPDYEKYKPLLAQVLLGDIIKEVTQEQPAQS